MLEQAGQTAAKLAGIWVCELCGKPVLTIVAKEIVGVLATGLFCLDCAAAETMLEDLAIRAIKETISDHGGYLHVLECGHEIWSSLDASVYRKRMYCSECLARSLVGFAKDGEAK